MTKEIASQSRDFSVYLEESFSLKFNGRKIVELSTPEIINLKFNEHFFLELTSLRQQASFLYNNLKLLR